MTHCFQVSLTGCKTSGTSECPHLVVASQLPASIAMGTQDVGNSTPQTTSSHFSSCANSKGKRMGSLRGGAPLLKQVQGSTDCCPGGYGVQFTCSIFFSGCNSTILTGCPHSGRGQYWLLLLFSPFWSTQYRTHCLFSPRRSHAPCDTWLSHTLHSGRFLLQVLITEMAGFAKMTLKIRLN